MSEAQKLLDDPGFRQLLARRSRLRWSFSAGLIGVYLLWGILGVYLPDAYAAPFFGIALPTGLALGFMIIGLSMILSSVYVRQVNRIEADATFDRDQLE